MALSRFQKTNLNKLNQLLRFVRTHLGSDITVQRLLILINVYLNEGMSQNELMQQLDLTSVTALSRNLADLSGITSSKKEGPGLIELRVDPMNLRKKRIYLTDKGKEFLSELLVQKTFKE
jgi:DNA-binding MarR family transcriptional regulator